MFVTLEKIKNYTRIDTDEDDQLLEILISAAQEFLENATGKKYPLLDENGNEIESKLAEIFVAQLVAYWYEQRNPLEMKIGEDFNKVTQSILLQLRFS